MKSKKIKALLAVTLVMAMFTTLLTFPSIAYAEQTESTNFALAAGNYTNYWTVNSYETSNIFSKKLISVGIVKNSNNPEPYVLPYSVTKTYTTSAPVTASSVTGFKIAGNRVTTKFCDTRTITFTAGSIVEWDKDSQSNGTYYVHGQVPSRIVSYRVDSKNNNTGVTTTIDAMNIYAPVQNTKYLKFIME